MVPKHLLSVVAVLAASSAAQAGGTPLLSPQVLFAPTNPVGVASELPRSPLTDVVVDASLRFATPLQAQSRCPNDVVVWVSLGSNFYRLAGDPRPDPNEIGAYMCQADASIEGDQPLTTLAKGVRPHR